MSFVERLRRWLGLCHHSWHKTEEIHEQNLRFGYDHWSVIYVCSKCGKHQTVELPKSNG